LTASRIGMPQQPITAIIHRISLPFPGDSSMERMLTASLMMVFAR
jgi:hypothetical protein